MPRSHFARSLYVGFILTVEPRPCGFYVAVAAIYELGGVIRWQYCGRIWMSGPALGALVSALVASGLLIALRDGRDIAARARSGSRSGSPDRAA